MENIALHPILHIKKNFEHCSCYTLNKFMKIQNVLKRKTLMHIQKYNMQNYVENFNFCSL